MQGPAPGAPLGVSHHGRDGSEARGHVQVYVDDMDTAVINMPLSLKYALKLSEGKALVGFTAATGSMWQNHDILDWRFQVASWPLLRIP
jgi:hypothetical protein